MSDPQSDLLTGLAADLNAAGVGVYDPARVWTAADTDVAVLFGRVPTAPDRVVVLTAYRLGPDDPAHPSGQINVQAYVRGRPNDPFDPDAVTGAVYDLWQGLKDRVYGSCHVTQAVNKSQIPAGYDTNNRREVASNFTFDVDLPDTALRTY